MDTVTHLLAELAAIVVCGGFMVVVTRSLVDVLRPSCGENSWTKAGLAAGAVAATTVAAWAALRLGVADVAPVGVGVAIAALVVSWVQTTLLARLFALPWSEALGVAPVLGMTMAALSVALFCAICAAPALVAMGAAALLVTVVRARSLAALRSHARAAKLLMAEPMPPALQRRF